MLEDNLKKQISRAASGSLGIKIVSTGLSFLTSVTLARLLGVSEYGLYIYAISWKGLVGFIAIFGFDRLLIKEISVFQSKQSWNEMRGLLHFSNKATALISTALFFVAILVTWFLVGKNDYHSFLALSIAFASLVPSALGSLRAATLSGLNLVLLGQLSELIILPSIFMILVGLVYFLGGNEVGIISIMITWLISVFINFLIGTFILFKKIPNLVKDSKPNYDHSRKWITNALPFIFISAMNVVLNKTDMIMLGTMTGTSAVGIYAVCTRTSQFVAFVLMAMNSALGPNIARLYANGQQEKLQNIITKTTRVVSLAAIPIVLVIVTCGKWLLSLYGNEFISGYSTLVILSISQLANVATGSVGLLLNMTGNQKQVAIGIGISACLNIVLNFLLIPPFGILGAAIATATSMVFQNIHLMFIVSKRLKIRSSVFG